ncbi:unnamed protein product [Phaeothamnion confervicola]
MTPTDHVYNYTAETGLQEQLFPVNAGANRDRCMAPGQNCIWLTDLNINAALAELDYHASRQQQELAAGLVPAPFFVYVAFSEPHVGFWSSLGGSPRGNVVPSDGRFASQTGWPAVERDHAAAIEVWHDMFVKKMMDRLTTLGLRSSTAVVYMSDNGASDESPETGGHSGAFFRSSGPLTGYKLWLTEGGIRVPAAISWPGRVVAGATSGAVQAIWDLAPTILDMAGIPAALWPARMDGVSLWKNIWLQPKSADGKVVAAPGFVHPPLYWERCSNGRGNRPTWAFARNGGAFSRAVMDGQWKGMALFYAGEFSEFRLYNLIADLGEHTDVAARYPLLTAQLKAVLASSAIRNATAGGFLYPANDACAGVYGAPLP